MGCLWEMFSASHRVDIAAPITVGRSHCTSSYNIPPPCAKNIQVVADRYFTCVFTSWSKNHGWHWTITLFLLHASQCNSRVALL